MSNRLDALVLYELSVDTLSGVSDIFDVLASQFTNNNSSLKKLRDIYLKEQSTRAFVSSMFVLLASFSDLQELYVQCVDCDKLDPDAIVNHGMTLRSLSVVNGGIHRKDDAKCYVTSDTVKIATACTVLEELCLNLYEIDDERDESDVLGSRHGIPFHPNRFEQALTAIASMPELRIQRLTKPPDYRNAYNRHGVRFR